MADFSFLPPENRAMGAGITTSRSHAEGAIRQVNDAGLDDRIAISLGDFHTITGKYDRIVSVGMLEHVPAGSMASISSALQTI